jgi:hypothetical protein
MEQINWEPILWVGGILVSCIVGELGFIVYMLRKDRESIMENIVDVRNVGNKHEKWILKQQKQLNKLGKRSDMSIELIKAEQLNNNERLKTFEQYLAGTKRKI